MYMQGFRARINSVILKIMMFIINYYINYSMPAVNNISLIIKFRSSKY